VIVSEKFGLGYHPNQNAIALHVEDVAAARAALTERGIEFVGETLDTGVCHMAFFSDSRRQRADASSPLRAARDGVLSGGRGAERCAGAL